jgi:hypothetical protein
MLAKWFFTRFYSIEQNGRQHTKTDYVREDRVSCQVFENSGKHFKKADFAYK